MKELMLSSTGDEVEFKYEDSDEILLYLNSEYPSVILREDVIDLIGFLCDFIEVGEK